MVLDGTGSYSPDLDPFDYLWAPKSFVLTDSTLTSDLTSTPVFHAADDGIESVTLEVTDDDGTGSDSALVYIENLPPVVAVGADESVPEGSSFSRSGSLTDPSARDTHTATVNYGDGTGVQALPLTPARTFSLSHVYADNGTYPLVVCVTDDDGASDCDGLSVTVSNATPVASAGIDESPTEGSVVSLAPGHLQRSRARSIRTPRRSIGATVQAPPGRLRITIRSARLERRRLRVCVRLSRLRRQWRVYRRGLCHR